MTIGTITSTLVFLCFVLILAFVGRFAQVAWRRTTHGRQIMLMNVAFVIIIGLSLSTRALGREYPGRDWVGLGCWAALTWIFWRQLALLVRDQRGAGMTPVERTNRMINMKREPALILAAVAALLGVVATLTPVGDVFPAGWSGAVMLVLNALLGAWTAARVKPLAPVAFTYLATCVVEALALWRFEVPAATVGAANVLIVAVVMLVRGQVTPTSDPAPTAPAQGPVR